MTFKLFSLNSSYPQTHNPPANTPPHLASSLLPPVLDDSIEEMHAELSEERLVRFSFPNTDFLHSSGDQTRVLHLSGEHPTTKLLPQTTVLPDRPCDTAQPVFERLILFPSPEGYSPPYLVF